MVALVQAVAYLGLEARSVEVQYQIAPGLPRFNVVGLPDKAVKESQERVHAALSAMGLSLPPKRISARGYTRMLWVARTIEDMSGSEGIGRIHVAEALSYRRVAPRA